jgi:sugar/nucleoside kinase (ribokinase family)
MTALGPVVSLGVHILDILGRPVSEIPPGQSSLLLEEIRVTAAGTAAGPSVDLARLGVTVYSAGAIGDDALGDLLHTLLEKNGVDTTFVVRKEGARTSATILPIRPNGERPALHAPGATQMLEPGDLTAALLGLDGAAPHAAADTIPAVLHLGGPDAIGAFAGEPLLEIAQAAKSQGTLVTMDLLRAGDAVEFARLRPLLELCDWFMPNEDQLRRLTETDDIEEAMAKARTAGAQAVAATRGAEGCSLDWGHGVVDIPSLPVEVVDTTGCGDGFDAGMITGLLLGCTYEEAAWLAVTCGALVATGLGSDAGITSLAGTIDLLEAHQPSVAASIRSRAGVRSGAGER